MVNPLCSTLIAYVPGCTAAKLKSPALLDVTLRASPVRSLVSVTVAPTTAFPDPSTTVPDILPLTVWATVSGTQIIKTANNKYCLERSITHPLTFDVRTQGMTTVFLRFLRVELCPVGRTRGVFLTLCSIA